jgi:hypothetical protein
MSPELQLGAVSYTNLFLFFLLRPGRCDTLHFGRALTPSFGVEPSNDMSSAFSKETPW